MDGKRWLEHLRSCESRVLLLIKYLMLINFYSMYILISAIGWGKFETTVVVWCSEIPTVRTIEYSSFFECLNGFLNYNPILHFLKKFSLSRIVFHIFCVFW